MTSTYLELDIFFQNEFPYTIKQHFVEHICKAFSTSKCGSLLFRSWWFYHSGPYVDSKHSVSILHNRLTLIFLNFESGNSSCLNSTHYFKLGEIFKPEQKHSLFSCMFAVIIRQKSEKISISRHGSFVLTGCRKAHVGLRQLPASQYQQSLGLSLAISLCLYSHSIPW